MTLSKAAPVVLIGAGKMGTALARGWVGAGLAPRDLVLVEPAPSPQLLEFASASDIEVRANTPAKAARVLVLAVKPQVIAEAMVGSREAVGATTLVLSIVAGVRADMLQSGLGTGRIVRTMPNTPAQIGKGITGAFAASGVDDADREVADALLAAAGKAVWVARESDLDIVTAVSGSGPAYVFHLVEAMAAAGQAEGLDKETATALARQTVIGAAALMEAEQGTVAGLRENVTSPGGTTAAALGVLMARDGLGALMKKAIRAARKRSEELGR